MTGRVLTALAALAATAVAVVVIAASSGDGYGLRLELDNASGLIEGAPVTMGSVDVGKVEDLGVDENGNVVAKLTVRSEHAPVGRDATAEIRSANLLGSKLVEIDPGSDERTLESGSRIEPSRVTTPVELQDVIDVLDADTRVRLSVLINEAGIALTGREADFNGLLARLPSTLTSATRMLEEFEGDNDALAQVVERSDSFLARLTPERRELGELVTAMAGTVETVAARREALREALRRAPGSLRTLQAFLADLRRTTVPLGPAARAIEDTGPSLTGALEALPGFERAARPTLRAARDVAPQLTRLARGATPVLRRAVPTLKTVSGFARDLAPAMSALDISIDDALGTIEGWSRAIQLRDGTSHYFRADLSIAPDLLQSAISKGDPVRKRRRSRGDGPKRPASPVDAVRKLVPDIGKLPELLKLPDVRDLVDPKKLPELGVPGKALTGERPARRPGNAQDLLDFLLAP